MSIRVRLITGFFILVIIFIVDFFVNQQLSREVIKNSLYLNNSETVMRNSNLLHKNMIDMQSGFRGYLLTDQENFLDPYYEGTKTIPPLIEEQRALVSSPMQLERLDSIARLHSDWLEYSISLISAKRDTLPESNLLYQQLFEERMKAGVGKNLNDYIKKIFSAFDASEYRTRHKRREALQISINHTRNITLGLTIFSIGVAIATSMLLITTISRRITSMVAFAEDIARGNFRQIDHIRKDELKKLSESLNTMSARLSKNFIELKKKNKELDQFAYVVSHDLKAPLRGIGNLIRWMEEDHGSDLTPDVRKNLDLIKGRSERLENMINGLLEYARIGRVAQNIVAVDVGKMLVELKEMLVPPSFRMVIGSNMPIISAEKIRLEQVFSNLISNAVKYHDRPDGNISITARELDKFYEFAITDDGPGIALEYHEKIFVIFQTLKERDAFESTGVGLAIVKKIIEEQNGIIRVQPGDGRGTTFVFTWPKN